MYADATVAHVYPSDWWDGLLSSPLSATLGVVAETWQETVINRQNATNAGDQAAINQMNMRLAKLGLIQARLVGEGNSADISDIVASIPAWVPSPSNPFNALFKGFGVGAVAVAGVLAFLALRGTRGRS